MSINLFQAILIGLWTAFCFSGMLLGIYTNRCIVLSFGVGIILGDLPTALTMGAIGELAYMGFGVGAGGTVPPNPIGPGIFGTLMAITSSTCSIYSNCRCNSICTNFCIYSTCRCARNSYEAFKKS